MVEAVTPEARQPVNRSYKVLERKGKKYGKSPKKLYP